MKSVYGDRGHLESLLKAGGGKGFYRRISPKWGDLINTGKQDRRPELGVEAAPWDQRRARGARVCQVHANVSAPRVLQIKTSSSLHELEMATSYGVLAAQTTALGEQLQRRKEVYCLCLCGTFACHAGMSQESLTSPDWGEP